VRRDTPRDPELETRLALAEAELRAMKDMLAEVRKSCDRGPGSCSCARSAPVMVASAGGLSP
jgi:hypothetical protein